MRRMIMMVSVLLTMAVTVGAQQLLPLDAKVRKGVLPNGLTYFVSRNEEPKERIEFHIAQRVGSIQEEDNQRGLAHFLEHMAFNGTKNFPGKSMLTYLQNSGLSFGRNINAYTSVEQTVYRLSDVPSTNKGLVDSCLLVLYDWASGISLEEAEIDSERGVIREEWRTSTNAMMRMWEKQLPEMYPNCRYGYRLPIGTMDVINNFTYKELRDYYHKWYRPDLQGIIVVGDVNVDEMEKKIVDLFSQIPAPVNAAEREYFTVPANEEPIVSIATDPEATMNVFMLFAKYPELPREVRPSDQALVIGVVNQLVTAMLNERIGELSMSGDQPFVQANVYDDNYFIADTERAFTTQIMCKEGRELEALKSIYRELERVARFGFTASEYERAKMNLLQSYENTFKERNKRKSLSVTEEIVRHFCNNEGMPGIEVELQVAQAVCSQLPLEQVNAQIMSVLTEKENRVYSYSGKASGAGFDQAAVLATVNEVLADATIEAPKEEAIDRTLITAPIKAGKVVKEKTDKFGNTVLTLSNKVKVVVRPTDYKDNEILFYAVSNGGVSLYGDEDAVTMGVANMVLPAAGVAGFKASDMQKKLAGKTVSLDFLVTANAENFKGNCVQSDLEELMQLIYLGFTTVGQDREGFDALKKQYAAHFKQMEANPRFEMSDSIVSTIYGKLPRVKNVTAADIESLTYDKAAALYRERTANAGDYTFVFVGNTSVDSIKKYAVKYIASLPASSKREKAKQSEPALRKGMISTIFDKETQVDKSSVRMAYTATVKYDDLENRMLANVLGKYLSIIYTETVREAEGGTYGVSVRSRISNNPKDEATLVISFDTNEQQQEKLRGIIDAELKKLAADGPNDEDFKKVILNLEKSHQEMVRTNGFWMQGITSYYLNNEDEISGTEELIKGVTPAKIQQMAKAFVESGNLSVVVMNQKIKN